MFEHPEAAGIHIVGPNPSMDRTQFLDRFDVGDVNRSVRADPMAGGKGLIVARALARLGTQVSIHGFLGGAVGQYIREECLRLELGDYHTAVAEETRVNTIIVDGATGDVTVVNEPGPRVAFDELETFFEQLQLQVCAGDIVAFSGSLPRDVDVSFGARLVRSTHERGARAIVDTSGESLHAAVAAAPWAIKCNLAEFRALCRDAPSELRGDADRALLLSQVRGLLDAGVVIAIVTLGAQGAIAVWESEAVWVSPPKVEVVNATGSGDTFLAGFLHAFAGGESIDEAVRFAVAASVANALLPLPDIGADPDLSDLLAGTVLVHLTDGGAVESGARS